MAKRRAASTRLTVGCAKAPCAATPFDGLSTAFCFLYSLIETNSSERRKNEATQRSSEENRLMEPIKLSGSRDCGVVAA